MAAESSSTDELLRGVSQGDRSALAQFSGRFSGLVTALARKACPGAQSQTVAGLARRALQACVDQLPLVGAAFVESEHALAAWVAVVCGRFLHEAKARRQLTSAAQQARTLLPDELPSVEHFDLRAYYRPSEWLSGDYYDALRRDDGTLVVLLADVMGHGAPAALMVSAVKCAFRMNAAAPDPAALLGRMNAALHGVLPESSFVVASLLFLGPEPGQCTFANAGMEGAMVVARSDRRLEPLSLPGTPIGLLDDAPYGHLPVQLRAGDCVFLCTDGVRDVRDADQQSLAASRLPELLWRAAAKGEDLYAPLAEALEEFGSAGGWVDDACFLIATAR